MSSRLRVLALALSTVASGCAARSTSSPVERAAGVHPWTVPGTLRIGMAQMPNTLNPLLRTELAELFLSQFVFDPLLATRADGMIEPKLATTVPTQRNGGISADGLTVTYHLRRGVRWHDGVPFTSNDVRFTYLAYVDPKNNVTTRTGYEDVARVETPDALTVVVRLARKSAPFVREFTTQGGVIPAHAFANPGALNEAAFDAAPIGTGPFKVVRWRRGERIEYVRNDAYALGRPKIAKIVVSFLPDENAAANALRSHALDWLWGMSTITYDHLRDLSTAHAALIRYNAFYGVLMNGGRPPLDDRRVRVAISDAIDRATLVKNVAFGAADAADADQPSFLWTRDPAFHGQRYDPAAAAALLRGAGWRRIGNGPLEKAGKPLALSMVFGTGNATSQTVAVQVQSRLHDLGIAVDLRAVTANQMFASYGEHGILARGNFDLDWSGFFQTDDPDDQTTFVCRNLPPHGFNFSRYCDPAFDAAQVRALTSYAPDDRKRAYADVERIVAADAPWAFVWWPRLPQIYDTDFRGYETSPGSQSLDPQTWSIGT